MIVGAQLYTVRDYIQTPSDIAFTLKKIADMGYKTVQVSAMGPIDPAELRKRCDDLGLKIVLTHTRPERILQETQQVIYEHEVLGCPYIGIGCMPDKYRNEDFYSRFVSDFGPAAKAIAKAGKLLMYHNHNFEFQKIGGVTLMDRLMTDFAPDEMGFTLDTYWVQAAGGDVCYWIDKLKGRIPCVHLKDMAVEGNTAVMAPIFEGNMNFDQIIKSCEKAGTTYLLVEQDTCKGSPFACLNTSFKNLKQYFAFGTGNALSR